ncbi:GNAT family N-acetyltransferase [Neobacillus sp. FSL H8-0543]|uniref:GNAT family N-acetyltransferase n=1 Tax=Neobacillus sp. FSL H8-0543 TaxID=2954672 RepID=UPI003158769E
MELSIRSMNEDFAVQILNWRYEPPYDFYNNEINPDALKELLDNPYYIVLDQNEEFVGFFCYGSSAQVPIGSQYGAYSEGFVDLGLGMNPRLTGHGLGATFFKFILLYLQGEFFGIPLRLTVAKFNNRAIHLYEKFGFVRKIEFKNGPINFLTMVKE